MNPPNTGRRRSSSTNNHVETFKFPDFEQPTPTKELLETHHEEAASGGISIRTSSPNAFKSANGSTPVGGWKPRRDSHVAWGNGHIGVTGVKGHGRQKSLSDAIKTIRTRKGSVSANAHEIADALKAPVSVKLIVLASQYKALDIILTLEIDPLPGLVHVLCPYQHLLEVDPQRLP